jgi:replicative DNA helicase
MSAPDVNLTTTAPESAERVRAALAAAVNHAEPARVHATAWRTRHCPAGTVGESVDLTPTVFGSHLDTYAETPIEKGTGIVYALAATSAGWSDEAATAVWGLPLDCDESPAHEVLTEQFKALGIAGLVQVRGSKHHGHLLFSRPIIPGNSDAEKKAFIRRMEFILERLGQLAGVRFDKHKAEAYASLVYAYTRRPDAPEATVETIAWDGAAVDPEVLLKELGYEEQPARARTNSTDSASAPAMSYEEVKALLDGAVVRWNIKRPPEGPDVYGLKRDVATQLVRTTMEAAGRRATEIDPDDLREVVAEFIGADRKHIANGARLVDSAVAEAFGERKPETVAHEVEERARFTETVFGKLHAKAASKDTSAPEVKDEPLVSAADDFAAMADMPPQTVLSTGFPMTDTLLDGGLKDGEMSVVVGPTGSAKTFKVLQIGLHQARLGQPVAIFETELVRRTIYARLAELAAPKSERVNPNKTLRDPKRVPTAAARLKGLPIYVFSFAEIDDDEDPIDFIRRQIDRVEKATGRRPLAIVDYAQDLTRVEEKYLRQGTHSVSKRLRLIATQKNIAILVVSSTSRANHLKTDQPISLEPADYLTTAKESGSVEYDAATLAFLVTLPKTDPEARYRDAALIVCKTRGGDMGAIGFKFDTHTGTFEEDPSALKRIEKRSVKATTDKTRDQLEYLVGLIKEAKVPPTRTELRAIHGVIANKFTQNIAGLLGERRIREVTGHDEKKRLVVVDLKPTGGLFKREEDPS